MKKRLLRILCAALLVTMTVGMVRVSPTLPYAYWNFRGSIPVSDNTGYAMMKTSAFNADLPESVPYRFLGKEYRQFIDGYIKGHKDRIWGMIML